MQSTSPVEPGRRGPGSTTHADAPPRRLAAWESALFGPAAVDRRQRLRMVRFFIASASSFLVIALFAVGHLLGFIPAGAFFGGSAMVLGAVVLFYAIFRF